MKEKKWHDDIPDGGVLCKHKNGTTVLIKQAVGKWGFDVSSLNSYYLDDLTPLTAAEFWKLAPWQRMDSYPRDGSWCFIRYKNSGWIDVNIPSEGDIRDDIEWLPLPQVSNEH